MSLSQCPEKFDASHYNLGEPIYENHSLGSCVYLATHKESGERLIVKQIPSHALPRYHKVWGNRAEIPLPSGRFSRYVSFSQPEGRYFFVALPYIPGKELPDALKESSDVLSQKRIFEVTRRTRELLEVVGVISHHGFVHRDVSLRNVIVSTYADDFSTTALIDPDLMIALDDPDANRICGHPWTISPEVLRDYKLYKNSDLYSVGITTLLALQGPVAEKMFERFQRCDPLDLWFAKASGTFFSHAQFDALVSDSLSYYPEECRDDFLTLCTFIRRTTLEDPQERVQTAEEASALLKGNA